MQITPITKENLSFYRSFITDEDARFVEDDLRIIPLGLVADDLENKGNMAAGALCIRPEDFVFNITSLYVAPEYRGRGAGKFLLDEAKRIFGKEDMEFDAEFFVYGEEEEGLSNFLESYGFTDADPEYEMYLTIVGELKSSKLYGKKGMGIPFQSVPTKSFNEFQNRAKDERIMLPLDGLVSERIDKDVSVAVLNEDRIECYAVVEKASKSAVLLSAIYAKEDMQISVLHMLEKVIALVSEKYSEDTKVLIQTIDENGDRAVQGLIPDIRNISCRYRYVI